MSSSFEKTSENPFEEYSSVDVENQRRQTDSSPLTVDAPLQYDDEHPAPISCNPMDWIKDLRKEYQEFTWNMTERRRVLLRAVFGEGLCTFLFLFTVMAASVNNGRQEQPENLVVGAIGTAFCAVAYIYSFADVSGAHFNPAVTFATMVTSKVSVRKGMAYIGIQILASIAATLWVMAVFPKNSITGMSVATQLLVNLDSNTELAHAFFMEASLSFILVYVIFATAFDTVDTTNAVNVNGEESSDVGRKLTIYTTSGSSKAGFAPIAIGFTLGFLGLLGGSVSGGCFNPARAFGPALINGSWDNHWIYWLGDFLGAALAGWAQSNFAHKATQKSASIRTNKSNKI